MNNRSLALAVLTASLLALPSVAVAQPPAEVLTSLALMTGSRTGAQTPASSMLIFPRNGSVTDAQVWNVTDEVASVQEKVKRAMGLSSLEMVSWTTVTMKVGDERVLPLEDGATLKLKLLAVRNGAAIYETTREAPAASGTGPVKTNISVPLGAFSIVGTSASEPYGFTVVGANTSATAGVIGSMVSYGRGTVAVSASGATTTGGTAAVVSRSGGAAGGIVTVNSAGVATSATVKPGSGAFAVGSPKGSTQAVYDIQKPEYVVTMPRLTPVRPRVPATAESGTVVLEGTIGVNGTIYDARVVKGPEGIAAKALEDFKTWVFTPGLDKDGNPVACPITVTLTYRGPEPSGE